MDSLFGNLFDFDGDGELDSFERAAEIGMMVEMIEDEESEENEEFGEDGIDEDDEDDGSRRKWMRMTLIFER